MEIVIISNLPEVSGIVFEERLLDLEEAIEWEVVNLEG